MTAHGSLYGLAHTNRQGKDLWGKNQFNSTFPAALACLMRDRNIPAVYIHSISGMRTQCKEMTMGEVFNTQKPNEQLFFDFESCYEPYQTLIEHELERVDLVVRKTVEKDGKIMPGNALRPLEVKLTVVPDNVTCDNPPDGWFPEMVIRPATIMYCCMGMAANLTPAQAKETFNPVGKDVRQ